MDIVWYSNSTVWFMIVIQLTKITNGFLHASYELNNTIIFPLLLVTQGIIFVTIVSFKSYFRLKIMFSLMVT